MDIILIAEDHESLNQWYSMPCFLYCMTEEELVIYSPWFTSSVFLHVTGLEIHLLAIFFCVLIYSLFQILPHFITSNLMYLFV